jgi:hypothetical protein
MNDTTWTSNGKLVFICSPYSGDIKKNKSFAQEYSTYAIVSHLNPRAPHLLYPQFLHDRDQEQREHGLRLALELLAKCDLMWVCGEHISDGMKGEIAEAERLGIPIEYVNEPPLPESDDRKLVYISAPYYVGGKHSFYTNIETTADYCAYAVLQGVNPISPHMLYPHFFDNFNMNIEEQGLAYALELLDKCDEVWVFGGHDYKNFDKHNNQSQEFVQAKMNSIPVKFIPDEEVNKCVYKDCDRKS